MKQFCWMVVVFLIALVFGAPSVAQDKPLLGKEAQTRDLKLKIQLLDCSKQQIQDQLAYLGFLLKDIENLKKMPRRLAENQEEDPEIFLAPKEEAYNRLIKLAPRHYPQEVLPILFLSLRQRSFPEELTPLQKRLIKRGEGEFFGMVVETLRVITEDKKFLENQVKDIEVQIQALQKQIKKMYEH